MFPRVRSRLRHVIALLSHFVAFYPRKHYISFYHHINAALKKYYYVEIPTTAGSAFARVIENCFIATDSCHQNPQAWHILPR